MILSFGMLLESSGDLMTQIGLGGVLLIMGLREILPRVLKSNGIPKEVHSETPLNNKEAIQELRRTVQFKDTCAETVKRFDTSLTSLQNTMERGFREVKEMIMKRKQS